MNTKNTVRKIFSAGAITLAMGATSLAANAASEQLLDCPLRDAPFSLDSPLIDILLNDQAFAALKAAIPAVDHFPKNMMRTETPSFAAIMNTRSLAGMTQTPDTVLQPLEAQLASIEVTDADRVARCARYDNTTPEFDLPEAEVTLLVFDKINGFDHGPSVTAATEAVKKIAADNGWAVAVTNKGGAFTADTLAQFDAVIWNNVSGDVLTLSQRAAFETYINNGGGFLGIHGSGGDPSYFWDWYADELLGARFIGHPNDPQFQDAQVHIEANATDVGKSLAPGWTMNDEWYSFDKSARDSGATVIATLDESTYKPEGMGRDLRMGDDHPIVWSRCMGEGRAFYSAIGHRPEVYAVKENVTLLTDALAWAAGQGKACAKAD